MMSTTHALEGYRDWQNRYFAMRHGQSQANAQKIIVSDPRNGCHRFGLTTLGREQVIASVARWQPLLSAPPLIVSSDFLRTLETADIARIALGVDTIHPERRLRERYFGSLDGGSDSTYEQVWDADAIDPEHQRFDVESARSVVARSTDAIVALERDYSDRDILLVAHGDVLQLLQTAIEQRPASEHRALEPLLTAEIRRLV